MITKKLNLSICTLIAFTGFFIDYSKADITIIKDVPYLEVSRSEKLDVYLPDFNKYSGKLPAVVWIHGGGWQTGSKNETRALNICSTLAKAGYVSISVEYKLGAGSWPTNLYDCKNAVRFLRFNNEKYHVDSTRMAVMGGSAGGHLALMVGLTSDKTNLEPESPYPGVSDSVMCIGDFYGVTNLFTRQKPGPHGEVTGVLSDDKEIKKVFGVTRHENEALLRDASPVFSITSKSPAVLILQGLADPTVNHGQSEELDSVLTQYSVPHKLILLQGVGHTFDLTSWNKKPLPIDLRPIVLDFLAKYVGTPSTK
jgi:acetyl esterase/lipase